MIDLKFPSNIIGFDCAPAGMNDAALVTQDEGRLFCGSFYDTFSANYSLIKMEVRDIKPGTKYMYTVCSRYGINFGRWSCLRKVPLRVMNDLQDGYCTFLFFLNDQQNPELTAIMLEYELAAFSIPIDSVLVVTNNIELVDTLSLNNIRAELY